MSALTERLLEPDIASLPDWQAAMALTQPDPRLPLAFAAVAARDVRRVMILSGAWPAIVMGAQSAASQPVRGACLTMQDTLDAFETIDCADPNIRQAISGVLDALLAAGVLTQAQHDAVAALMQRPQSWAQANNVAVDARAVGLARGAI